MRKFIIALVVLVAMAQAQAQRTMICETISGQQFVWVGQMCPPGSFFAGF